MDETELRILPVKIAGTRARLQIKFCDKYKTNKMTDFTNFSDAITALRNIIEIDKFKRVFNEQKYFEVKIKENFLQTTRLAKRTKHTQKTHHKQRKENLKLKFPQDLDNEFLNAVNLRLQFLGFLAFSMSESTLSSFVDEFEVSSKFQNMGVGKTLMNHLIKITPRDISLIVDKNESPKAFHFYDKYGFQQILKPESFEIGILKSSEICMQRKKNTASTADLTVSNDDYHIITLPSHLFVLFLQKTNYQPLKKVSTEYEIYKNSHVLVCCREY